jgi:hypothetical protein
VGWSRLDVDRWIPEVRNMKIYSAADMRRAFRSGWEHNRDISVRLIEDMAWEYWPDPEEEVARQRDLERLLSGGVGLTGTRAYRTQ